MDLFCPHCTRRVTVSDEKAGQVLSCPLCAKQFMAPALAPVVVAPKPVPIPSAPVETFALGAAPVLPPVSTPSPAVIQLAPFPPPPPLPPGDYTRTCNCTLTGEWLAFVPPACLLLIFLLSFLTWHWISTTSSFILWGLAFSEIQAAFLLYTLLLLLCLPLSVVALLFDKGLIPAPPPLAPLLMFKNLLIGLLLGLAFLLLCFDYIRSHTGAEINPIALAMKLAFQLHFVALLASFLLFWLSWRKKFNLPPPKCDVRW